MRRTSARAACRGGWNGGGSRSLMRIEYGMHPGEETDAAGVEPGPQAHAPDRALSFRDRDRRAGGGAFAAGVDPQPARLKAHRRAVRTSPGKDAHVLPEEKTVASVCALPVTGAQEHGRRSPGVVPEADLREVLRVAPAHEPAGVEPVTDETARVPAREGDAAHPVKGLRWQRRRGPPRASLDVGEQGEAGDDGKEKRPPEGRGGNLHGAAAPPRASSRRSMTSRTAPRPPPRRVT